MTYYNYSKNILTSVLFIFPFLIIYEFIAFFKFRNLSYQIRNTADIIIRDCISIFTDNIMVFYSFLLFLFVIFIVIFRLNEIKSFVFNLRYITVMYAEGLFFGILLVILLNGINVFSYESFNMLFDNYLLSFYFCVGAAIWEEILFRLLLINFIIFTLQYIDISIFFSVLISIVISSILFSSFHYIGSSSDTFTMYSFLYRFLGGLYLSILYYYRGIGISMMSHFIYDFLLITVPIL